MTDTDGILVDAEMISPVSKIRGLSSLIDNLSDDVNIDEIAFMGIARLLDSVADEIMQKAEELNFRIATLQEKGGAS